MASSLVRSLLVSHLLSGRRTNIFSVAFKQGKMPSNAQADIALNSLLSSDLLNPDSAWNRKLSSDGRQLIKDSAAVVESAKVLWLTKNRDNLFQEFLWHSAHVGDSSKHKTSNEPTITGDAPLTSRDSATLYEDHHDNVSGLKNLGTLIITNGQFRKLCMYNCNLTVVDSHC